MAHWGNIILVVWGTQSSLSLAEELRKLMSLVAGEHTQMSLVHVCVGTIPMPTKEVRAAFAATNDDFADKVAHVALSIGDEGFWASAVRSVVTHIQGLAQRGPKTQLCGSVQEISSYMARNHVTQAGVLVKAEALQKAVEWLLAHPRLRSAGGK